MKATIEIGAREAAEDVKNLHVWLFSFGVRPKYTALQIHKPRVFCGVTLWLVFRAWVLALSTRFQRPVFALFRWDVCHRPDSVREYRLHLPIKRE